MAQNNVVASNGVVLEVARDPYSYLKFNAGTSTVTPGWIGYLDGIGKYFRDSLAKKDLQYICLTPMLANAERSFEPQLASSRTKFIINYLLNNYGLDSDDVVIRSTLFDQKASAVNVIILDKDRDQLTRRQLRQLKRKEKRERPDEDKYFIEDPKQAK